MRSAEKNIRKPVEKVKEIHVSGEFTAADIMRHCTVAPGRVLLEKSTGYVRTAGGLEMNLNADPRMKGTSDSVFYGVVVGCGAYAKRDGTLSECPGFPLPAGTYVEHTTPLPQMTAEGMVIINAVEIVRTWAPGNPPPWWRETGA